MNKIGGGAGIRFVTAACTFLVVSGSIHAENMVISEHGNIDPARAEAITGECDEDGLKLKCTFVDLTISPYLGDNSGDLSIYENNLRDVFRGKAGRYKEGYAEQCARAIIPPNSPALRTELGHAAAKACASPSQANLREFARQILRTDRVTCSVHVSLPYDVILSKDGENKWSVREGPDPKDSCGLIRTFTLQRDGEYLFRITRTWFITNRGGRDSCEQVRDDSQSYSWKVKDAYRHCERLYFGF